MICLIDTNDIWYFTKYFQIYLFTVFITYRPSELKKNHI